MNAVIANLRSFESRNPSTSASAVPAAAQPVTRHLHRERDFGVGYGNSSGYASERRYTSNWVQPLFRCG